MSSISISTTEYDLEMKLSGMKKRSAQLQIDRSALIAFNKMNLDLPENDRHIWQRVLESKGGAVKTMKYNRIVDNKSLESLLSTPTIKTVVDTILVSNGGPELNISANIRKKY